MGCVHIIALFVLALSASVSPKPIMVSFGTNQGPIVPPPTTTTQIPQPKDRRAPAPVFESADDVPNPSVYKPLVPQQYRNRLFSFKPNPNLILGTAQDQKYHLANSDKFNLFKKQQARAIGFDYRGPQFFESQQYEIDRLLQQQQQKPTAKQLFQPILQPAESQRNIQNQPVSVPEIGIVYSSGVRYYIPQIPYYQDQPSQQQQQQQQEQQHHENSVYDKNDSKYLYYNVEGGQN